MSYPLNLYRALYNYHHGKTTLSNHPMIGQIEMTNYCNAKCWFCPRDMMKLDAGFISDETFNAIVNERNAKMLRRVAIFMRGEPLLHPHLERNVKKLRQYATMVNLATNGLLLDRTKAKRLIEAGVNNFNVSFEGVNEDIYGRMRGLDFHTVKENLVNLIDLKEKADVPIVVKACYVLCDLTRDGFSAFAREWLRRGVDDVVAFPLRNWNGVMPFEEATNYAKRIDKPCLLPWTSTYFQWSGDISPCCSYLFRPHLGNVNEKSVSELWNDEPYVALRQSLLDGNGTLPICRVCDLNNVQDDFLASVCPEKCFPFSKGFLHLTRDMSRKILRRIV
jgi:MoaA/NifB/PqqE/SkfB family radical SAM enzyme